VREKGGFGQQVKHSSPAVSQILPTPPFSRRELPLLHKPPLRKGKRGGFEPQVGIAIASQPPLRKGGKGGFEPQAGKGRVWATSGKGGIWATSGKGGFEPQVEKGRIYLQNNVDCISKRNSDEKIK